MPSRKHALRLAPMALAWLLAFACAAAQAQSFDCRAARAKPDLAICASPALRQLDVQMAAAFSAALARDPAQAGALRQDQRNWLNTRNGCLDDPAANAEACLARSYAARIGVLALAAATATAPPAVVVATPPPAAATVDLDHFASAGQHDTLLHVSRPGRFAIRAESTTGTALQLVDMMTGPGERGGVAGGTDARIDALLDVGTYKLRAFGAEDAAGESRLSVTGFADMSPPQLAPGYQPASLRLIDLHQQSFWLVVGDADEDVRFEAAGRSLADIRVWHDGRDLVEFPSQRDVIAPVAGHPLNHVLLSGRLPPGSYLVTLYGGPALAWADGASDQPLLVRAGQSDALLSGGGSFTIGPFGRELYAVPPNAADVRVTLPAAADVSLRARSGDRTADQLDMTRKNRAATALLHLPGGPHGSLEVSAALGTV